MNLLKDHNQILQNYAQIRSRYKSRAEGISSPINPPVTDRHGFFLNRGNQLGERTAGLDKLFYTLIDGIVEDPDFAVRKDSV